MIMILAMKDWNFCAALLLATVFLIAFQVMKLLGRGGRARPAIKNARAALVTFGGLRLCRGPTSGIAVHPVHRNAAGKPVQFVCREPGQAGAVAQAAASRSQC